MLVFAKVILSIRDRAARAEVVPWATEALGGFTRNMTDRIPAGRSGRPDELAGPAVFLASPASDYMHGSMLVIDGGWLSR